jgi:hypothetical protein
MTEQEIARFALVLREAERVRLQMAKDEAAARMDGRSDLLLAEGERSFGPAMVAAT